MLNVANAPTIKSFRLAIYMCPTMVKEFKEQLTELRSATEATQATETVKYEKIADENDVASMQEALTLGLRLRERNTLLLKKINKSLLKIDNDDYGYCDTCGGEIGADRLRARPTANHCISCKEQSELGERQYSKRISS